MRANPKYGTYDNKSKHRAAARLPRSRCCASTCSPTRSRTSRSSSARSSPRTRLAAGGLRASTAGAARLLVSEVANAAHRDKGKKNAAAASTWTPSSTSCAAPHLPSQARWEGGRRAREGGYALKRHGARRARRGLGPSSALVGDSTVQPRVGHHRRRAVQGEVHVPPLDPRGQVRLPQLAVARADARGRGGRRRRRWRRSTSTSSRSASRAAPTPSTARSR